MVFTAHANVQLASVFGAAAMALAVLAVRLRAARKPVSSMKIVMPPVGMSTGFFMFLYAPMRIPPVWGVLAFLVGAVLFSYPLIRSSRFHLINGEVYLQRSRAFVFVLLGMLIVRLLLRGYIERFVTVPQTGALFFILAFGMLLPWRVAMYRQYRRLLADADGTRPDAPRTV